MKKILVSLMIMLTGVTFFTVMTPTEVYAATTTASCEKNFLGFRPWYKGLTEVVDGKCEVKSPKNGDDIATGFVLPIILNVLADLFVAAGYLVSAFIIMGGYNYMTAMGDPGKIAKAKKTISSAVIGLAIVIFANVIINLIVGALTTTA